MIPAIVAKSMSNFQDTEPSDLKVVVCYLSEAISIGKLVVEIPKAKLINPNIVRFNLLCLGYEVVDYNDSYSVGWG